MQKCPEFIFLLSGLLMLIPVTFGQAQYRPGGGNNAGGAASDAGGMVIDININVLVMFEL